MKKIDTFLFSVSAKGDKFIIYTLEPPCIFLITDKAGSETKALLLQVFGNPTRQSTESMDVIRKKAEEWYCNTIVAQNRK